MDRQRARLRVTPGRPQGWNSTQKSVLYGAGNRMEDPMGRYALLWFLGIPIPILLLIWAFGGLN